MSNPTEASTDPNRVRTHRDERQHQVTRWATDAFGAEETGSVTHRAVRFGEEAIEAIQAAGVSREKLHHLVDRIYDRPVGDLYQELGGVGVTVLILASAAGVSANDAEADEIKRVLAKSAKEWQQRNHEKNAAGFTGVDKAA